jgi:arylsulfatase A-like enzyme
MPIVQTPSVGELDVSDKPAWVRGLPAFEPVGRGELIEQHRDSYETLLAVDEAVRRIIDALESRGDLDHTVIVYLSDNGYSFGEHRWIKKTCPYEECTHVPFLIRYPLGPRRVEQGLVSAVDLAPTIADLAGITPPASVDGESFAPLITRGETSADPDIVYLEWVGDERIPAWWQIRTPELAYIELATGERELYDMVADPYQLSNVVDEPEYAADVELLAATLEAYRGP